MLKIKISNILKQKNIKPITCLTAYSKATAQLSDGLCDIILVGDSLGQVLYGMKTTKEVNLDTMILHGKAVKRHVKKSLVVVDMPYKTYKNKIIAYKNAKKIIKSTKCDAVKLEGGKNISKEGFKSPRTVVVEFLSYDDAVKCYNSNEYKEALSILKNHAKRSLQIIEGA